MLVRKLLMVLCAAVTASAAIAQPAPPASEKPTKAAVVNGVIDGGEPKYLYPETPEKRKERLGTAEEPGNNPDPDKHYWRFGHSMHIEKYDRRWASYDDVEPGMVRPFAFVNVQKELYQQNDKWVWVWVQDVSEEEMQTLMHPKPVSRYTDQQIDYYKKVRSEFLETQPKGNETVVHFQEASDGLPTSGSWRNSGAVADMNGDGCPDIIAPSERAGGNVPAIFLGDCKGHWKYWSEAKWPRGIDYGSVVAADFNKDGHMDLAFGVHLTGVTVLLGDGKGNFTDSSVGLPDDFPTRRILITDVDGDGYPDIVGINEGPTSPRQRNNPTAGRLRVFLNREKGKRWEALAVTGPETPVGGDWLSIGNFNGDKTPDFIASSIFFNSNETVYLSSAAKQWKMMQDSTGNVVPFLSYYFANAAGKFSSSKRDDAIVSFVRFWPGDLSDDVVASPPAKEIIGIDRLSFADKEPKRTPIVRWSGNRGVWGLAAGDFNHDGNLDFLYTRYDPREAVLMLGDGKGGFTQAKVDGITLPPNTNYDVLVADVNNDGLPDVILMYESSGATAFASRDGSIHVFLNKGASRVDATRKTAAAK